MLLIFGTIEIRSAVEILAIEFYCFGQGYFLLLGELYELLVQNRWPLHNAMGWRSRGPVFCIAKEICKLFRIWTLSPKRPSREFAKA